MKKWLPVAMGLLSACQLSSQPKAVNTLAILESPTGEQRTFLVEVADDASERARGLMFREHLAEDAGMLFVFAEEQPLAFWMKNTFIPLDILYIAANGSIVSWTTMTPCEVEPCKSYPSLALAKYALEVPAGVVEKQGISTNWHLVLE